MRELAAEVSIHVLTADTFGTVRSQIQQHPCTLTVLEGEDHDIQKESVVTRLGAEHVFALGNGNNDRRMLASARVGVAVLEEEGCAGDAVRNADIVVRSAISGLDLLLKPLRLKATLRT
jgi:soluble P-type ATPase